MSSCQRTVGRLSRGSCLAFNRFGFGVGWGVTGFGHDCCRHIVSEDRRMGIRLVKNRADHCQNYFVHKSGKALGMTDVCRYSSVTETTPKKRRLVAESTSTGRLAQ